MDSEEVQKIIMSFLKNLYSTKLGRKWMTF